jgi:hypothetical protein
MIIAGLVAAVLLLSGCASGPQTQDERKSAWIAALSATIEDAHLEGAVAPNIFFAPGGQGLFVNVYAASGTTWPGVESQLKVILAALAEDPFNAFEVNVDVVGNQQLTWQLYDPNALDMVLAATKIWYDVRDEVTEDATITGDIVRIRVETTGDPDALKAQLVDDFTEAGIDVARSDIVVVSA